MPAKKNRPAKKATSKQVALKFERLTSYPNERMSHVQWLRSLPFFLSNAGYLVHRVRSAKSHLWDGELTHTSIKFLCQNSGFLDRGELLAAPPKGRILCEFCELMAKKLEMRSADQIVGRHCHVGKIRVEQTCCREKQEFN